MPSPADPSIRLVFQGINSNVLHVGLSTDKKKEGKFTLALALTNSRRDDMHIFVQLSSDLDILGAPAASANSMYKITPENSFKGHKRANPTSQVFDEAGDVLFAKIPKVISSEDDSTNDAVFKWDFQVKGKLSKTLEHTIKAWVVTRGDDMHESETINAVNPPIFKLFQVAPNVTAPALQSKSGSMNVVPDNKKSWVRELTDTKLTGTVPVGTQFLAVQFSADNGANWSAWRTATVTGHAFTLDTPLSGLTLKKDVVQGVKVRFSQTPETVRADYTNGVSQAVDIDVIYHTAKPLISAKLTNGTAGKLALKPDVLSKGPELDTVEYSTNNGQTWVTVAHKKTLATSFAEPLSLDPGDFSQGIKLRATDKTGLVSEQPWATIDSALVEAKVGGQDISYGQPGSGSSFIVSIKPGNDKLKLPPAHATLKWANELEPGAEMSTPAHPTELSYYIFEYLTLKAPSKIWNVIPALNVQLDGTKGTYSPSPITAPFVSPHHYIPEKPEFLLDPIGGAFNSNHVVLSGKFNQIPSKPSDLIFEYSIDSQKPYKSLASPAIQLTDSHFTLHLPEADFPDKSRNKPSIRVRYKHNTIEGLESTVQVSSDIIVDNNLPAVTSGSVTFDARNGSFKASGVIRQTAMTANHITHYAMAWAGEEEGNIPADKWVALTPSEAEKATVRYEVTAPRDAIKGILQPKLLMKTASGTVIDQHLYSQYAYGMIDIVTPTATGLTLEPSSSLHSFVFKVERSKVSASNFGFELTLPIRLFVGLNRVNITAVLNDYSDAAKFGLQETKHLSATPTPDPKNQSLLDSWGDAVDTQLLSLSGQEKNTGYSITFPLMIKKGAPKGDYKLTVSFKDVLRSAFSDVTSVSIVFRVA